MKLSISQSVFLVGRLDKAFKFKVPFFVYKLMELSGELDNLEVGNTHFGKDFFQSVQFDHSGLVVLTREQAESVLYIR